MAGDLVTPVRAWNVRNPSATSVTCGESTLTRGEFELWSDLIAGELLRRGAGKGDRVALMAGLDLASSAAVVGILKSGAALVPLSERLSATEVGEILGRVEPFAVIADNERIGVAAEAHSASAGATWAVYDLGDLQSSARERVTGVEIGHSDLALIAFTSGSTGRPKGAMFRHGDVLDAMLEWVLQEPLLLRPRVLTVTSNAYLGGLLNGLIAPQIFGGATVLLPKWDPAVALDLISRHEITTMAGTSIFFEQMAAHRAFATTDVSSLTVAIAGGSPVSPDLVRTWHARGVSLRQGYGLTEGCSIVTLPPAEVAANHPDVAGVGGVLREVRIFGEDGAPAEAGDPGEIRIRGPGITFGFWRDPAADAEELADGWLRTGDIGTIDDHGHLRIVGRQKDVIISGGINIYAAELERIIGELPGVAEVAVIGVPHEKFGETPAALVVPDGTVSLTADDVTGYCRRRLASYKVPRRVEFLDEPLPRTQLGKVVKPALRERYSSTSQSVEAMPILPNSVRIEEVRLTGETWPN